MTTQDIQTRLDVSGLTVVTGSEIKQTTDTAYPASDKGLIIESTDTALDTPVVPNPATELEGITPTYWTRYRWHRKPFTGAGADARVKKYVWNPNKASDATLLKWENEDDLANEAAEDAAEALAAANAAQVTANAANATANTASTNAGIALNVANEALEDVSSVEATVTILNSTVTSHGTRITALENATEGATPITDGGTGATTVNGALVNLGLNKTPVAFVLFKDVKASTTNGGTFTAGAWQTRELNTVNSIGDVDFFNNNGDNTFSLERGSYIIEIEAPAFGVEAHQAALYNEGSATIHTLGSVEYSQISTGPVLTKSKVIALVTINGTNTYSVKHRCQSTVASNGFGAAAGFDAEVYTTVKITKLQS